MLMASCWTDAAEARDTRVIQIEISATNLADALGELSREAGISIGTEGGLPPIHTPAIHGRMGVEEALRRLLTGSGYVARQVGPSAWRIERRASVPERPLAAPQSRPTPPLPSASETYVDREPIIVTAPKRSISLEDLPMAMSVMRLDPVRAAMPDNGTAMIAAGNEGLAMTSPGPGRNRVFLRGIADSAFNGESQSTVAVVLDETRLTYSAPDPDIRLVDVDRVEVLKGPQGSLYGTGALGGIFHIVTRRADPDKTTLSVSANGQSVAHGGMGGGASAVGNLPLAPETAALRLVGYWAVEPGWIDTGARKDSNRTRLLGGRANLGIEAGDGWRADLSGLLQLLESRDSGYVYSPGARARPAQLAEPHDNDMRHLSARLARTRGDLDVTISSGISWHEVGSTLDATAGADGFGLASPNLLLDERLYRVWDSEVRIGRKTGGGRWLLGVNHVEARQNALWTLLSRSGARSAIDDDRRNTRDTALFGDLSQPLGSGFSFDAGARLFRSTVIESRRLATGVVSRHKHRSGLTPSVALSWKPGPGEIVYLRYGSAYRQGATDLGATGQLESLKSDELQTIEAGWRRELGHGGRLDLGLYASRWENLQSDQLESSGLIETVSAGNARIFGAEATLHLPLGHSTRLEAGASFTSALLTRNRLGTQLDDRRLPVVPRYAARAELTRRFALGPAGGEVRLSLRHVGPQRLSFDPVIDRPMGSYWESGIDVQARIGQMRLFVAVENPFGGSKDRFAFGNPLRFATLRQYTPQRPASVSLGSAIEF